MKLILLFKLLKHTGLFLSLMLPAIAVGQSVVQAETTQAETKQAAIDKIEVKPVQSEPHSTAQSHKQEAIPTTVVASNSDIKSQPLATLPGSRPQNSIPEPAKTQSSQLPIPVPGSSATKAASLLAESTVSPGSNPQTLETPAQNAPSQAPTAFVTQYQFNYVGIGANFGAGGETGLGEISFALFSKLALTPNLSFRPSVLIGDDTSFLLPITYDFSIPGPGHLAPYAGLGVKFSTGNQDNTDLLLTAGVDYPINPQLAATFGVNIGPINNFDIGFLLGIAYTFSTRTITTPVTATAVSMSSLAPQQPPRPNPSYVGVGVNFGTGGDSGLGNISGAIYSKVALNSYLSLRPAVFIQDNATFLLPVTYDFPVMKASEYLKFAPFAGIGASFSTGNDNTANLLLTAGVDVPISSQLTATAAINVGPIDTFNFGFLLGIAYTFGKFE